MKVSQLPLFIFFTILLWSCQSQKDAFKADYTALGVEEIIINNESYRLNGLLLENKEGVNHLAYVGGNAETGKLTYIISPDFADSLDINIKSQHPDTYLSIGESEDDTSKNYRVVISRTGYREELTYIFKLKK